MWLARWAKRKLSTFDHDLRWREALQRPPIFRFSKPSLEPAELLFRGFYQNRKFLFSGPRIRLTCATRAARHKDGSAIVDEE